MREAVILRCVPSTRIGSNASRGCHTLLSSTSKMLRRLQSALALVLTFALTVSAQERVQERVDLGVVHQIKAEAFQNPKVMENVFQLTDVYGPRLTNSPQF